MIANTAYVRNGFRSGNVDICTMLTPLPQEVIRFGQADENGFVRIKTRSGDFLRVWAALDLLRDLDWTVFPDVPQFTADDIGYITASRLRERGWTPGLIDEHLADADKEVRNPHYSTRSAMRLFALTRVKCLERIPEIAEVIAAATSRRKAKKR